MGKDFYFSARAAVGAARPTGAVVAEPETAEASAKQPPKRKERVPMNTTASPPPAKRPRHGPAPGRGMGRQLIATADGLRIKVFDAARRDVPAQPWAGGVGRGGAAPAGWARTAPPARVDSGQPSQQPQQHTRATAVGKAAAPGLPAEAKGGVSDHGALESIDI